jgi:hypothetical protein
VIIDTSSTCAQAAFSFGSAAAARSYDIKVKNFRALIKMIELIIIQLFNIVHLFFNFFAGHAVCMPR